MRVLVVTAAALLATVARAAPTAPPPPLDLGDNGHEALDLGDNGPTPVLEVPDADITGVFEISRPSEAPPAAVPLEVPADDAASADDDVSDDEVAVDDGVGDDGESEATVDADFREPLAPYGSWVDVDGVGPAFRPDVDAAWEPYTRGHWEDTDAGWLWVSDEPFAWACYHYGRWAFVDDGWLWIPGSVWAPSWVVWNYASGYVGWSPLMYPGYAPAFVYVERTHFRDRDIAHSRVVPHVVHRPAAHAQNGTASPRVRTRPRPDRFHAHERPTPHPTASTRHTAWSSAERPRAMHAQRFTAPRSTSRPHASPPAASAHVHASTTSSTRRRR